MISEIKSTLPPHLEVKVEPTERVLFFSDAHLDSDQTPESRLRTGRVLEFLEFARANCEILVILGDLFDFYFEYRTVFPSRYLRVMSALDSLSTSGVRCYYAAGNHDFWLGELFSESLGVTLARDAILFRRVGDPAQTVLAAHGDGLGPGDTSYKVLKKLLRSRLLISLFRLIHPDWGYAIARHTSHTSRKYTLRIQNARIEASARNGRHLLESNPGLNAVILAHTHCPERREFGEGVYFNTGDWCTHCSYISWTSEGLYLERFGQQR